MAMPERICAYRAHAKHREIHNQRLINRHRDLITNILFFDYVISMFRIIHVPACSGKKRDQCQGTAGGGGYPNSNSHAYHQACFVCLLALLFIGDRSIEPKILQASPACIHDTNLLTLRILTSESVGRYLPH